MVTGTKTGRDFRSTAHGFGVCAAAVLVLYLISGMNAIYLRETSLSLLMALLTCACAFYVTSAFIEIKKKYLSLLSSVPAFGIYMLIFRLSFDSVGRKTMPCLGIMEGVLFWAGLGTVAVSVAVLALGHKLKSEDAVTAVLAAGFVIRAVMVLFTPMNYQQHDVSNFSGNQAGFHDSYILYIYENLTIPDVDVRDYGQFYHPPLHYILSALFLRLHNVLPMKYAKDVNGLKFLPMLWTSFLILFSKKSLEQLKITGKSLSFSMMLIVFCPQMIFLAIQVNNDALALMLFTCSIYLALKWYAKPELTTILLLAISIGCAMMTKLSMGFVAFPVAWIFLAKFVDAVRTGNKAPRLMKQFGAFAALVFPLGMWFPLRNLFVYRVPVTYVYEIDSSANMDVWMYSAFQRLFAPSKELLSTPFLQEGKDLNDYNVLLCLIKTGLFDERNFDNSYLTVIGLMLMWLSFVMVLYILFLAISVSVRRFKASGRKILSCTAGISLWILTAVLVFAETVFCFRHPVVCTGAFRYIAPVLIPAAFACGSIIGEEGTDKRLKAFSVILKGLILLFVLFVVMFYGPFIQYAGPWQNMIRG